MMQDFGKNLASGMVFILTIFCMIIIAVFVAAFILDGIGKIIVLTVGGIAILATIAWMHKQLKA
ncbi:MAG: hypothetical protein QXN55_00615 [Candidatus Nitrosotenuis sp.]